MNILNNKSIYFLGILILSVSSIWFSWKFDYLLPIPIRLFNIGLLLFLTLNRTNKDFTINSIGLIGLITLLFSDFITEKLILGNVISEGYMGEDAGYYELKLYKKNKYKMTYGGAISGDSKNFVGTYLISRNNLIVDKKNILMSLKGQTITHQGADFYITDLFLEQNEISRILKFEYQGYSDDMKSYLYLNVIDEKTHKPIDSVYIGIRETSLEYYTTISKPEVEIKLDDGIYNILIHKHGYRRLELSNYQSKGDRVSLCTVVLVKGNDIDNEKIPEPIE